jgi:hypothetical protein
MSKNLCCSMISGLTAQKARYPTKKTFPVPGWSILLGGFLFNDL